MAAILHCPSCSRRLRLPENLPTTKLKCPACGAALSVPQARSEEPPAGRSPERDAADEESPAVRRDRGSVPRRPPHQPTRRDEAEEPEREEREKQEEREERRPRRKKKKRRRESAPGGVPEWIPWVAGTAVALVIVLVVALVAVQKGHGAAVAGRAIALLILVPVSTAILIGSMFVTSFVAGGIDFGEARTTIPKAAALLLVVNALEMLPYGIWLAIPVWWLGLVRLFQLDWWEAWLLSAVNWVLNVGAVLLVVGLMVGALAQIGDGPGDWHPPAPPASPQERQVIALVEKLGGSYETDPDQPSHPVVEVSLMETAATDAHLAEVAKLTSLQSLDLEATQVTDAGLAHLGTLTALEHLDLSNTRVTDAGLVHLQKLKNLQSLVVDGTRVTPAGLQNLRRALPGLEVEH